ncbi:MAG: hypothetical protein J6Y25_00900 [Elusimicrobiaceae bacterium]|nr:hypothetical protein [Elusimicrobiaceae bacterium]MBP5616978.1 hypothetical protein [Elusimicrobiaceae bacterium]
MKKVIAVLLAVSCLGTAFAAVAPVKKKFVRSVIVQGKSATKYEGVNLTVPQGQTVLIGRRDNGSIIIRGKDLDNFQIEKTSISSEGYTVMSYRPSDHIVFLNTGDSMTVTDPKGKVAKVFKKGAVDIFDARHNSNEVVALEEEAVQDAAEVAEELGLTTIPGFVEENTTTSSAYEQAEQDVEATLSSSAPRS